MQGGTWCKEFGYWAPRCCRNGTRLGFRLRLAYIAPTVAIRDAEKERRRLAELYRGMSEGELRKVAEDGGSLTVEAKEALRFEISRRGLDIEVRDSAADTVESSRLVTLRQFRDLPEALLAKGALDSAGIESFLGDDNVVRMDWFLSNAIGGVKLRVREEDAAAASALLDQQRPEAFDVEAVGEYKQPRCPNCGSLDVSFQELIKRVAYSSLAGLWLAGIVPPIPLKRLGWKCHSCGHSWEGSSDSPEKAP